VKALTKKLTREEVVQALYVDYEGNMDLPPTLLGWRVDGANFGAIVDQSFATCADRYRASGVLRRDHGELVQELIARAEAEQRRLVSWSEHDCRQMLAVLPDPDWQMRLHAVYRNAIKTARPWYRSVYGESPPKAELQHFLICLGHPPPERYGQGVVGSALRLLRTQLSEGRTYPELTPKARKGWVQVVKHNRLDLEGMEVVLRSATAHWLI